MTKSRSQLASRRNARERRIQLKEPPVFVPAATAVDALVVPASDPTVSEAVVLPRAVPSAEIRRMLNAAVNRPGYQMTQAWLADAAYCLVDKSWLLGAYARWWATHISLWDIPKWMEEAHDCDDFAVLYGGCARVAHARRIKTLKGDDPRTGIPFRKTGFAIGEIWYQDARVGGHAINWAATPEGIIFIEPQTGWEKNLTADEMLSAYLLKA